MSPNHARLGAPDTTPTTRHSIRRTRTMRRHGPLFRLLVALTALPAFLGCGADPGGEFNDGINVANTLPITSATTINPMSPL